MNLNKRETATVLAALRQFQTIPAEAYPHFDDCDPLTPKQIDRLCERINTNHEPKVLKKPLGTEQIKALIEGVLQSGTIKLPGMGMHHLPPNFLEALSKIWKG